jgi:hypothetical protein
MLIRWACLMLCSVNGDYPTSRNRQFGRAEVATFRCTRIFEWHSDLENKSKGDAVRYNKARRKQAVAAWSDKYRYGDDCGRTKKIMQGDVVLTSQRRENTACPEPFENKYESRKNIHADVLDNPQNREIEICQGIGGVYRLRLLGAECCCSQKGNR